MYVVSDGEPVCFGYLVRIQGFVFLTLDDICISSSCFVGFASMFARGLVRLGNGVIDGLVWAMVAVMLRRLIVRAESGCGSCGWRYGK